MDSVDNKEGKFWRLTRAIIHFLWRITIFSFGLLYLCYWFYEQFEGDFALWEISKLEIIFWVMLCGICLRHYRLCQKAGAGLVDTIYKPVANLGRVVVMVLLLLIVGLVIVFNVDGPAGITDLTFAAPENHLFQVLEFGVILLCVFYATYRVEPLSDSSRRMGDSTDSVVEAGQ